MEIKFNDACIYFHVEILPIFKKKKDQNRIYPNQSSNCCQIYFDECHKGVNLLLSIWFQKPFCAINESDVFSEATLRSDHPIVYKYHEKQKERKQKRNKLNGRKKSLDPFIKHARRK